MSFETVKPAIDVAAGGITVSAMMGWVVPVTAVLSLLWIIIRLYETVTIQSWIQGVKELIKKMRKK